MRVTICVIFLFLVIGCAAGYGYAEDRVAQVELGIAIGGEFTPDSVGPARYAEIKAKLDADPRKYLAILESEYLKVPFNAMQFSSLYIPNFLQGCSTREPATSSRLAKYFLSQLNQTLFIYDLAGDKEKLQSSLTYDQQNTLKRLLERRELLNSLSSLSP
jgi:hypothetical protein